MQQEGATAIRVEDRQLDADGLLLQIDDDDEAQQPLTQVMKTS